MRFTTIAVLATLASLSMAAATGPVQPDKRQVSPCVEACMQDLGIFDGHAHQLCREQCGELKKRSAEPAVVKERQPVLTPCVEDCLEELQIPADGKGISICRRRCGEAKVKVKREAPVVAAVERRQAGESECYKACLDASDIKDGKAREGCRYQCGEL